MYWRTVGVGATLSADAGHKGSHSKQQFFLSEATCPVEVTMRAITPTFDRDLSLFFLCRLNVPNARRAWLHRCARCLAVSSRRKEKMDVVLRFAAQRRASGPWPAGLGVEIGRAHV